MKRVDTILDLLDVGLQSSSESGYVDDVDHSKCARCRLQPRGKTGDLCEGCRGFLLGDDNRDPREHDVHVYIVDLEAFAAGLSTFYESFTHVATQVAEAITSIAEWLTRSFGGRDWQQTLRWARQVQGVGGYRSRWSARARRRRRTKP